MTIELLSEFLERQGFSVQIHENLLGLSDSRYPNTLVILTIVDMKIDHIALAHKLYVHSSVDLLASYPYLGPHTLYLRTPPHLSSPDFEAEWVEFYQRMSQSFL